MGCSLQANQPSSPTVIDVKTASVCADRTLLGTGQFGFCDHCKAAFDRPATLYIEISAVKPPSYGRFSLAL